jgi:hypothetical protein
MREDRVDPVLRGYPGVLAAGPKAMYDSSEYSE